MSVIYKKATTREQVIKYIRDLDIYHIKKHGTVLVLPFTDKETKKLIVKELKRHITTIEVLSCFRVMTFKRDFFFYWEYNRKRNLLFFICPKSSMNQIILILFSFAYWLIHTLTHRLPFHK